MSTTPVPDRDQYLKAWGGLHGGYDPATGMRIVRLWLTMTYRLGRPLAVRGVPPDAVTVLGVLVTLLMLVPVRIGGHWIALAVLVVVTSGLLDNLDGCVAVLTHRTTSWGYVLDSVADRVSDAIYLVTLWQAGASAPLCVAAGSMVGLLEYTRARAGSAGFGEIGVVTVGERPTRIIVTAIALLGAGLVPGRAGLAGTIGAAATLGVCVIGFVQLVVVVRRALSGRADQIGDDLR